MIDEAGWLVQVKIAIDPDLKRPITDQFALGLSSQPLPSWQLSVVGLARRQTNLIHLVNEGVPVSGYTTFTIPDANADYVGPADDQQLLVYNRKPETFGLDRNVLTNPGVDAATMGAVVVLMQFWRPAAEQTTSTLPIGTAPPIPSAPVAGPAWKAWLPWIFLSCFVFAWGLPQVKGKLNDWFAPQIPVPVLNLAIDKVPPVAPKPTPEFVPPKAEPADAQPAKPEAQPEAAAEA